MAYISFFHGRKTADEEMDDWGFPGPIVGPVNVSWTYGDVKVHRIKAKINIDGQRVPDQENWGDFESLSIKDGLIQIDGAFYGDFEVWPDDDSLVGLPSDRPTYSYKEFLTKNGK